MGFRCSLLGHDYGDSEVDRDRKERGDEVVVTVHEFRTCARCGKTKTVSENKEVTSIADEDAAVDEATTAGGDDGSVAAESTGPMAGKSDAGQDGDPVDTVTEAESPEAEADPTDAAGTAEANAATDDASAGDERIQDDAVILDDDSPEAGERGYGEWPEPEESAPSVDDRGSTEWPEQSGGDEGYAASTPDGDTSPDVEFSDGEIAPGTTEYPDDDAHILDDEPAGATTAEQVTSEDGESGSGITSAGSVPSPDTASRSAGPTDLVCPECQTTVRSRESLRQGDICPECKLGYLTERERNR